VWLDDHRIAGGQGGEQARVGVPGREGRAADHQRRSPADHLEVLLHHQRRVLALRLLPVRLARHEAHFTVRISHRLQPAILGVRPAGLEGHAEALAGGVHHRPGDLEAGLVQPVEDLQAHAGAAVDAQLLPGDHGRRGGSEQRLGVADRVLHAEIDAIGRAITGQPAGDAGLAEVEALGEQRMHRLLADFAGALSVDLRTGLFRIGSPVAARGDRLERAFQRRAVSVEQGMRHFGLRDCCGA
jgi:hypothetical protein